MAHPKKILLSIPAKNEARTIASVITKCKKHLDAIPESTTTILVINDGSTDDTVVRAKQVGAIVHSHEKSIGLGAVFQEAVEYATETGHDIMITIDGDGQFSEDDIPAMLEPLLQNTADCTTGSRFIEGSITTNIPPAKLWGNKVVAKLVSSIVGKKINDVSCGFRAYNKKALYNLNLFNRFTYTQEVLLNLGYKHMRITEVPITTQYFSERKSRIAHNLINYGWRVLKMMLSFMLFYQPLKLFSYLAVANLALGVPATGFVLFHYIETSTITPYKALGIIGVTFLVLAILFFIVGIVMHSFSRLQLSVDRTLYYQKLNAYKHD